MYEKHITRQKYTCDRKWACASYILKTKSIFATNSGTKVIAVIMSWDFKQTNKKTVAHPEYSQTRIKKKKKASKAIQTIRIKVKGKWVETCRIPRFILHNQSGTAAVQLSGGKNNNKKTPNKSTHTQTTHRPLSSPPFSSSLCPHLSLVPSSTTGGN